MTHYGMAIDTNLCLGCWTCATACKQENNLPKDMWWNRVLTDGGETMRTARGTYPDNLRMKFYTVSCQHCENPACVKVCPVGATYKEEDTGIVRQDYDKCIGCRMCMSACPYTGVRSFNWEEPQFHFDWPIGDPDVPAHQKHTVEKCTFCNNKLAKGEKPACVDICVGRARFFGDLDDPESDVSKALAGREWEQLLPEQGTKPSLYYLV